MVLLFNAMPFVTPVPEEKISATWLPNTCMFVEFDAKISIPTGEKNAVPVYRRLVMLLFFITTVLHALDTKIPLSVSPNAASKFPIILPSTVQPKLSPVRKIPIFRIALASVPARSLFSMRIVVPF